MAFRTNKVPVLQEKSASGAIASFNTALAMPLVECKTEFMCTQASGTPSPSNPLAITGVDDITIMANGNSVVIDLDGTRYGGYVDVVGKKLVVDRNIYQYSTAQCYASQQYIKSDACAAYIFNTNIYPLKPASQQNQQLCDKLEFNTYSIWAYVGYANQWVVNQNSIIVNIANDLIGVTDYTQETPTSVASKIRDYLMVEKPIFTIPIEPIEIPLSDIPTLSTIIGNNSFASDSGSVELKYKDLDIAKRGNFREVFKLPS